MLIQSQLNNWEGDREGGFENKLVWDYYSVIYSPWWRTGRERWRTWPWWGGETPPLCPRWPGTRAGTRWSRQSWSCSPLSPRGCSPPQIVSSQSSVIKVRHSDSGGGCSAEIRVLQNWIKHSQCRVTAFLSWSGFLRMLRGLTGAPCEIFCFSSLK